MDQKDYKIPELEGVDLDAVPTPDQDAEELDLDAILREFSGPVEQDPITLLTALEKLQFPEDQVKEPEEVVVEAPTEEDALPASQVQEAEEVVQEAPMEEEVSPAVQEAEMESTVAFPPIREDDIVAPESVTDDTVAFEPVTAQAVSDDTVSFEPVNEAAVSSDTIGIRQEAPAPATSDTVPFTPVGNPGETVEEMDLKDQQRLEELHQQAQEKKEPFSEQWEPEYEQPMGEYVPAPPIIMHPRSRLKELKRKLIEGPEKRYYALAEMGFGKLYFAIFVCLLAVFASIIISVLNGAGLIPEARQKLLVFSQLFLMLIAALLGSFQIQEGLTDPLTGRFTLNTMLVVTFCICSVDAVICLDSLRVPCCAAFSLQMLMSLWSTYHKRTTEMGMMDTMRKAVQLDKVAAKKEYYNSKTGFLRGDGQVEDFMDTYNEPSAPEKFQGWVALGSLVISLVLGVVAYLRYDAHIAVQVIAVSLLASTPAAAFISVSRPFAVLENRLHKLGTVLCGWSGIQGLKEKAVLPVDHQDLFPAGTVKMNGVKFFGTRETDQVVAYAAALVCADGGGLAPLFEQVLQSRNGRHYDVEALRSYDGGGIGGEVCGEPVLVGLLPFLRDMGVEIPEGLRVDQAVYVAIDGELCGLFALSYERSGSVVSAVHSLCNCLGVKPLLTNTDFMLTKSFLRAKFGIRPKKLLIPDYEQCSQLKAQKPDDNSIALLLTTKDGLAPIAFGVTGARALHTAAWMGAILHLIGGLVGLIIVAYLVLRNGISMLTPDNMFLFQLAWLIPALLISEWTRSV